MNFGRRTALHLATIKAARQIAQEIEKAGLDNLKVLAENSISIVGAYLDYCSAQEKKEIRSGLSMVINWGVTPDMLLTEIARQMPELAPIMEGREGYKQGEIKKLEEFLRGG